MDVYLAQMLIIKMTENVKAYLFLSDL